MSTQHTLGPIVPTGMTVATKDDFFAALKADKADKRDIMPTTEAREHTPWRVVTNRAMWGWSSTGYASKSGTPTVYALAKSTGSAA